MQFLDFCSQIKSAVPKMMVRALQQSYSLVEYFLLSSSTSFVFFFKS